ncbi:MAG TPA: hypothetical protein VHV49_11195 [Pseudonocardiaceae bacterium]|nr:hypothetical protein [Pseudonocardiaceae bacterium]
MFVAVLASLAACAGGHLIWHLFTCRSHRGAHARADVLYSPDTFATQINDERRSGRRKHRAQ